MEKMETVFAQYMLSTCGWRIVSTAVGRGYGKVYLCGREAAVNTAGMAFFCGMDDIVRVDGNQCCSYLAGEGYAAAQCGVKSVCAAVDRELFWSLIFFNVGAYGFAAIWLLLLWILVVFMICRFYRVDRRSSLLQIPYLIWLTFALYLNIGAWVLNV